MRAARSRGGHEEQATDVVEHSGEAHTHGEGRSARWRRPKPVGRPARRSLPAAPYTDAAPESHPTNIWGTFVHLAPRDRASELAAEPIEHATGPYLPAIQGCATDGPDPQDICDGVCTAGTLETHGDASSLWHSPTACSSPSPVIRTAAVASSWKALCRWPSPGQRWARGRRCPAATHQRPDGGCCLRC